MKTKTFSVLITALFAVFLMASLVSADMSFVQSSITDTIYTGTTSTSFSFDLNYTGTLEGAYTLNWTKTTDYGTLAISSEPSTLNEGQTHSLSATLSDIPEDFVGDITGTIKVDNQTGTVSASLPFTISVTAPTEIVECNQTGMPLDMDLRVKKIDFNNKGIINGQILKHLGDDNTWYPFENIEVQIEVKNYGEYDADNVEVAWGLYNVETGEWVIEPDTEKDFRLKNGDTETLTVDFKLDDSMDVDIDELTDGNDYRFYVTVTGDVDDSDSVNDGDAFCTYNSENSEVTIDRDFVILDNFEYFNNVQCGEDISFTGDIWNIGDRDQDNVYMVAYNKDLGINEQLILGDINSFDSVNFPIDFVASIPKGAEEKPYDIKFTLYDEDGEVFQTDDDEESIFHAYITVEGGCIPEKQIVISSPSLVSGGEAGDEMTLELTLTNTGSSQATYTLNAASWTTWSDSAVLDPSSVTLASGESRKITATFQVKDDVSGMQTFNFEATSDGGFVASQPITNIPVEEKKGFWSSITGGVIGAEESNLLGWLLGLISVVLLVIVIVLAVRLAKK